MSDVLLLESDVPPPVGKSRIRKTFSDIRAVMSARIWARRNAKDLDLFLVMKENTSLVLQLERAGGIRRSDWVPAIAKARLQGFSIQQASEIRASVEAVITQRMEPLLSGFNILDREFVSAAIPDAAAMVVEFVGAAWLFELVGDTTLSPLVRSSRRGRSASDPLEKKPVKLPSFRRRGPHEVLAEAKAAIDAQREKIQWARRRIVRDRNVKDPVPKEREEELVDPMQAFRIFESLDLAERSRPYQEKNEEMFKG